MSNSETRKTVPTSLAFALSISVLALFLTAPSGAQGPVLMAQEPSVTVPLPHPPQSPLSYFTERQLYSLNQEFNAEALESDLRSALEQMQTSGVHLPKLAAPKEWAPLPVIQSSLGTKKNGFQYLKSEALSSSPNVFHVFYRHKNDKEGRELTESVLAQLKERSFIAFPQKLGGKGNLAPSAPVVLAFNFVDAENPFPLSHQTLVAANSRSPIGFHNDLHSISQKDRESMNLQVQEYLVPTQRVRHWAPPSPEQVADMVEINNSLASAKSLYVSVSQSFGAHMAYLELFLNVSFGDFVQSSRKLLRVLAESRKLSLSHLKQDFCPAPTDYFIMGSNLRPTFHSISGRNMAFVSHDFEVESYSQWMILSQIFNTSTKPLVIEDCGWPKELTDDFKRTVSSWWKKMSAVGDDPQAFQRTKFLCEP